MKKQIQLNKCKNENSMFSRNWDMVSDEIIFTDFLREKNKGIRRKNYNNISNILPKVKSASYLEKRSLIDMDQVKRENI